MRTLWEPADLDRLRDAFEAAGYDLASITERLGEAGYRAAERGDYRGLLAVTTDLDPQATLIRLFLAPLEVPREKASAALAPFRLETALESGLLVAEGDRVRAGMSLRPHGSWLVLSDLPAGTAGLSDDHVLGVGEAARSMARYMRRIPVDSALDLGTGCGILALELSGHAETVTATDVSARAVTFAATTAALNGRTWQTARGDMFEPLAGHRFDHIVSNPPFIVGPGRTDFDYRDSGRPGDAVCAELARHARDSLNPGGTLQFMANWQHEAGQTWQDRVAGWFAGTGCDVWAVERDVLDPLDYVRMWERDSASHDPKLQAEWLDWFDANGVTGVGFGLVTAQFNDASEPTIVCETLPEGSVPSGHMVDGWCDNTRLLRDLDDTALLEARLRVRDDVRLSQDAVLGEAGWDVQHQALWREADSGGMTTRTEDIDPLLVSLLGGCSGAVPLRTQIGLLATAHEAPESLLAGALLPVVRRLIRHGFITVASN